VTTVFFFNYQKKNTFKGYYSGYNLVIF